MQDIHCPPDPYGYRRLRLCSVGYRSAFNHQQEQYEICSRSSVIDFHSTQRRALRILSLVVARRLKNLGFVLVMDVVLERGRMFVSKGILHLQRSSISLRSRQAKFRCFQSCHSLGQAYFLMCNATYIVVRRHHGQLHIYLRSSWSQELIRCSEILQSGLHQRYGELSIVLVCLYIKRSWAGAPYVK